MSIMSLWAKVVICLTTAKIYFSSVGEMKAKLILGRNIKVRELCFSGFTCLSLRTLKKLPKRTYCKLYIFRNFVTALLLITIKMFLRNTKFRIIFSSSCQRVIKI